MDRFRFHDAALQDALQRLYAASGIPCETDADGALVCGDEHEAAAESLRSAIRYRRFPGWHTTCIASGAPEDWTDEDESYRAAVLRYVAERAIPHEIEEHGESTWLLLPDDEVVPDTIWESIHGPVSTLVPVNPECCFCRERIEGPAFGEVSVRRPAGGFRSILYSHLECLRERLHAEAVRVMDTED